MPKIDSQIRIFNLVGNKQYSYHKIEWNKPCSFWCFCMAWLALSCKRTIYRVNIWRSYFFISSEVNSARQSHFLLSLKKFATVRRQIALSINCIVFLMEKWRATSNKRSIISVVCICAFESHVLLKNKFKVQAKGVLWLEPKKMKSRGCWKFHFTGTNFVKIDLVDFMTLNWRSYFVKPSQVLQVLLWVICVNF